MRLLITTLLASLLAAPAAGGMLDGYLDPEGGKLGLLSGVDVARGPEEWAFYIQLGQPWGH
jgi:hypothetical protein